MAEAARDDRSVDVVVVSYQAGRWIDRLVRELRGSRGVAPRVIVVDNASSDASSAVATEAGAKVLQRKDNGGYGAACNDGIALATAEFLVVANQDLSVHPDVLRHLTDAVVEWEERLQRPVVAGPSLERPDGSAAETCHNLPTLRSQVVELVAGARFSGMRNSARSREPGPCGWVSAAFIAARRETFLRVGGFDDAYFMYVEDVDFFDRAANLGVTCVWVPSTSVIHFGGAPTSPDMHAEALLNWRRYFASRRGRRAGTLVFVAGLVGAATHAAFLSARRLFGDSDAGPPIRMFTRGAVLAWRRRKGSPFSIGG